MLFSVIQSGNNVNATLKIRQYPEAFREILKNGGCLSGGYIILWVYNFRRRGPSTWQTVVQGKKLRIVPSHRTSRDRVQALLPRIARGEREAPPELASKMAGRSGGSLANR